MEFVSGIVRELWGQWGALVLAAGWLFYKSGIAQQVFGLRASERAQLSTDHQRLVDNMQRAIDRLNRRMTEEWEECERRRSVDREECERRLSEYRDECDREIQQMQNSISDLTRGEARWRHLVGNLAQYVAALQAVLRKAGLDVPRFAGWDHFIIEGGDPTIPLDSGDS